MPTKGKLSGVYVNCEWCGKLVYKTQTDFNKHKHHYCSNECQLLKQHADKYEDRPCEICGTLMHVRKKSTQRFCSTDCQKIWQTQQVGILNKRFMRKETNCDYCNKEFFIKKYKLDNEQHHFCSKECRQAWFAEVWSQSEDWKIKKRQMTIKQLSENKFINTLTKPQIVVNSILDNNNIQYVNEQPFIYYSVDNYLVDIGLVIEVMGNYWHGNPIKFNTLNDMQIKNIKRDKAKHTFLKNNYGVDVLYLWEFDVITNPELCWQLIKLYIEKCGVLDNYDSFNYQIKDGQLCLKDCLITAYKDMDYNYMIKHHTKTAV